ncbi:MAG: AraC family transcriptional regulator [Lentisphaeria bacterium]|nr:AraC family transcriptional regulator [Lentisphaeria bacterium]
MTKESDTVLENIVPADFPLFIQRVKEPENLFSGLRLSNEFCLPDNLLVFYHPYVEKTLPRPHGRCTFVIALDEMVYYIERTKFVLKPGQAVFIPPYAWRFLHPDSSGYRRLFITFDVHSMTFFRQFIGKHTLTENSWQLLKRFLNLYFDENANDAVLCLLEFLYSVKHVEESVVEKTPKLNVKLEQALEYIQSHLEYVTDLWSVARQCNLSESHLRNLFKKEFGISAGKYIALQRFEAAKYMLLNTTLSIQEIAVKAGFASQFVFSTFFRRHAGTAPLAYRNARGRE